MHSKTNLKRKRKLLKRRSRSGLRMWRPLMVERKDLSLYLCPLGTILMPAKFCSLSSPLLWETYIRRYSWPGYTPVY
jgi:hypothetical protein